ncbi:MAG: SoxR reducing system RseC family protein [Kangiellaceae bacterium]|nr:SoxR reducing system RseC family protein [Kangiellaceae bacterium]
MLIETGIVSAIQGDHASVSTQNQLACSSCKEADSCGNGILEKFFSGKIFVTEMKNLIGAKIGDKVSIHIPKSSVTKAALVVYILPLIFMILTALVVSSFGATENWTILSSLIGLLVGLFVTKYYNHKILNRESYLPKMVSIIDTKAKIAGNSEIIPTVSS